eukprot:6553681-Pyramimonas_sp.AAC.1
MLARGGQESHGTQEQTVWPVGRATGSQQETARRTNALADRACPGRAVGEACSNMRNIVHRHRSGEL